MLKPRSLNVRLSLVFFFFFLLVSVLGVVLIAPISSYVAPFGARLAHALPRRRLEIGFGLFLLVAATRFVISLVQ